ncbi:MAG: CocE/NonD family hydrolase [Pseudomonadota bacterium]
MRHVTEFPFKIEKHDPVWIEMPDGVRLSASVWRPLDETPVPAILEFLPYRRSDGTAERDALTHPYFSGHGYACIRVDMRGSGDSDGVLKGEYLPQEQDDALAVIDWLTQQEWCDGNVGMIGISWGGFNGLQVAARQPEALKAIVSICSTDDRYADDIHYMGGCLLLDNPWWHSYMFSLNTTPPDPDVVGNRWYQIWQERLQGSGFWIGEWLKHQQRDEFWKQGSVCEDFSKIKAAVYAVGGWADGYTNAVFRLLEGLQSPCKGLVGPWAHKYPHFAKPGPAIGFLQECLRWWDYWLKGVDTGIMEEPQLRVWVQDPVPPLPFYKERPGKWVAEAGWPSARIEWTDLFLNAGGLASNAEVSGRLSIGSPNNTGQFGGRWCAFGLEADGPEDQRGEEGGSLVFDGPVVEEAFDILGAPVLEVDLESDKPVAILAAVLSDVAPNGAVTKVSLGILNLSHRNSHENPEPLRPGARYSVKVKLNDCGHRFEPGHRVRIALSTAYWPMIWPMPEQATLQILTGESVLRLPVRPESAGDAELKEFAPPEAAAPLDAETIVPSSFQRWFERDVSTGIIRCRQKDDEGVTEFREHNGWKVASTHEETYSIHPDDPLSATFEVQWTEDYSRGNWQVRTETTTRMTSTKTDFIVTGEMVAFLGEEEVHRQSFEEIIPRELV